MSLNSIKINTNEVIRVDEQPTVGSDNLVKSGGVSSILSNIDVNGLVSCGGTIMESTLKWLADRSYYGALIDVSTIGEYIYIIPSIRSSGYTFVKDEPTWSSDVNFASGYSKIIWTRNDIIVQIPNDAKYLFIYLQSPGVDYRPQRITSCAKEIGKVNISNGVFGKEIEEIQIYKLVSCSGTINMHTNLWQADSTYYGAIFEISQHRGKYVYILPNDSLRREDYTFLKERPSWGNTPVYADGYNSVVIGYGKTIVQVPSDAVYMYIYLQSPGVDYRPQRMAIYEDDKIGVFSEMESTVFDILQDNKELREEIGQLHKLQPVSPLVVATWNIGHFSGGGSPDSTITSADYAEKLAQYREVVYEQIKANVLSVNEYSRVFGDNKLAKDVLFNDYPIIFEGEQNHYSCNAMFGDVYLENIVKHDYECLQDETITHTSAILATDYYYISADLYIRGRKIKLFVIHLAFDSNRPSVLQEKQIAELISVAANESKVLMLGDWNIYEQADFDAFVQDGYTLANDGTIYTYPSTSPNKALDNIIVKGLTLSNVGVVQSALSDHIPLYATINI